MAGLKPWWLCSKCGWEWQAMIRNRKYGTGCPACAGQVTTPKNCFAAKNPELAKEWHPTKNDLTPYDVTSGSEKRAWWLCSKCKHEWEAIVSNRSKGKGCPACSGRVATPQNCLAIKNPQLAAEWHPTKNGKLTPYDVRPKSNKKIWWVCKKYKHEWQAAINDRSNSNGCPSCSGRVATAETCLAAQNPRLVKEWHPSKNRDLTPYDVKTGSHNQVWWVCRKCKWEWKANIRNRSILKRGCPACANKVVTSKNCLAVKNLKLAAEWHPTKNGDLTPYDMVPGSGKKVWWLCKKCKYEWQATINNRSNRTGCPACVGKAATPKNCFAIKFPELAKEWHPTKNKDLTPHDVVPKSHKKVWWKCKKYEHVWKAAISHRSNGRGCLACWNVRRRKKNV